MWGIGCEVGSGCSVCVCACVCVCVCVCAREVWWVSGWVERPFESASDVAARLLCVHFDQHRPHQLPHRTASLPSSTSLTPLPLLLPLVHPSFSLPHLSEFFVDHFILLQLSQQLRALRDERVQLFHRLLDATDLLLHLRLQPTGGPLIHRQEEEEEEEIERGTDAA